jgi:hypothetical protein
VITDVNHHTQPGYWFLLFYLAKDQVGNHFRLNKDETEILIFASKLLPSGVSLILVDNKSIL